MSDSRNIGRSVETIRRVGAEPIEVYRWPNGEIEVDFGGDERMTRRQAIRLANALLAATDTRGLRRKANFQKMLEVVEKEMKS